MIKRFFNDSKKYFHYSVVSARAALKAEVANSYLNWIWWILEPACFTAIYAFVFGSIFNASEEFFIIFIVIGISVWDFFSRTVKNSVNIMRANKPIVSRVYLPKYILIFVKIGVNGFKMLISFGIAVILMICFQVPISWRIVLSIPLMINLLLFTFGFSCFLLHFGVFIADLSNIVDIVLRFVFYITGIFYSLINKLPEPFGKILVTFNPVAYCINQLRNVLLYRTSPNYWVVLAWFAVSLLLSIVGVRLVYNNENSYVKSI